jgi:hypothetical protein
MPDLPQSDDPPTEETEDPDVKHGGAQPVLWALLGLLLIGAFVLALQAHWFGGNWFSG